MVLVEVVGNKGPSLAGMVRLAKPRLNFAASRRGVVGYFVRQLAEPLLAWEVTARIRIDVDMEGGFIRSFVAIIILVPIPLRPKAGDGLDMAIR
jgi:hypothetical protein